MDQIVREVNARTWSHEHSVAMQRAMRSGGKAAKRERDPEALHNAFNAPDVDSKDINDKAEALIRITEMINVKYYTMI